MGGVPRGILVRRHRAFVLAGKAVEAATPWGASDRRRAFRAAETNARQHVPDGRKIICSRRAVQAGEGGGGWAVNDTFFFFFRTSGTQQAAPARQTTRRRRKRRSAAAVFCANLSRRAALLQATSAIWRTIQTVQDSAPNSRNRTPALSYPF